MTDPGVVLFSRGNTNSDFDDVWDDTALIAAYDKAVNSAKEILRQRRDTSSLSGSVSESSTNVENPVRNANRRRRREKTPQNKWAFSWKCGDHCRAVYSVDGQLYEADIQSVNSSNGTCVVQFLGYGNFEEVLPERLQASGGEPAREAQMKEAELAMSHVNVDTHVLNSSNNNNNKPKGKHGWKQNKYPKGGFGDPPRRNLSKAEKRRSSSSSSSRAPFIPGYVPGATNQMPFFASPWANSPSSSIPPMHLPPPPLPFSEDTDEDDEALSSMLMAWYMSGYHTGFYQGLKCAKNRQTAVCSATYSSNREPSCSHKCST